MLACLSGLLHVLKNQCHEIFASDFFHESSSPKPLKITWSFQFFSKIRWDVQHRWLIIGTISADYLRLKVNLKEKIYLYHNSSTQRCVNKIMKTFQIKELFHLPPISQRFLRNFEMARMGYSGTWGKLIHVKPKVENLVALSL